jgi:hypothetical protein
MTSNTIPLSLLKINSSRSSLYLSINTLHNHYLLLGSNKYLFFLFLTHLFLFLTHLFLFLTHLFHLLLLFYRIKVELIEIEV